MEDGAEEMKNEKAEKRCEGICKFLPQLQSSVIADWF